MHSEFLPLLLITVLAFVVPVFSSRLRRFRLPIVVGEIIAGMIIGKSGLNIVQPSATLSFLAEFGFVFLMFLSGLEINFEALSAATRGGGDSPRWKKPLPLVGISFVGTLSLALLIGFVLVEFGMARNAILMGLILSTTSLGIVVPILKERGMVGSHYGQLLLIAALISDFITLLLLSLVIAILSRGIGLDLLLFMVLLLAFAAAAKISRWMDRIPAFHRVIEDLSHATAQIRVRGAFALMVVWVVLAEAMGVEVILGAFLAGAVLSISNRSGKEEVHDKLDAIGYGFFIPIFFINVGANFDLPALLGSPAALLLLPVLIVSAYLVKVLPALLFRVRLPWRETLAAGVLLSSRLSLIIAASAIALELGMITPATNAAVILVAIISCTVSPVLFSRILPPEKTQKREGDVILGTDQLAILLGQRLKLTNEPLRFIGHDEESLNHLGQIGFESIYGSPVEVSTLEAAKIDSARALIAVTVLKESLVQVCRLAIEYYRVPIVVARADDPQTARELEAMGVRVVQTSMASVLALEVALEFPTAFSMFVNKNDEVEVKDIRLTNADLFGRRLHSVHLPGNALVIGVERGGEIIVPHGDTLLNQDDKLLLIGSAECLIESTALLNGNPE